MMQPKDEGPFVNAKATRLDGNDWPGRPFAHLSTWGGRNRGGGRRGGLARRRLGFLLLVLLSLGSMPTWADNETVGGVKWNYTASNGTAIVTGAKPGPAALRIPGELGGFPVAAIGDCAFFECVDWREATIPDSVKTIGERAFFNCSGLTNMAMGRGVTNIGNRAFAECYGLQSIEVVPENPVYASEDGMLFSRDRKMFLLRPAAKPGANHVVPDGVVAIGDMAFAHCFGLTNIVLPDSATTIGSRAFAQCLNLTDLVLPDGVTHIGNSAFERCFAVKNFSIPCGVTTIEWGTFEECRFTEMTIPDGVTDIGSWAFLGCTKLTNVIIGAGVTNIGDGAFQSCRALPALSIPDTVAHVGKWVFVDCKALISLDVPGKWRGTDALLDAGIPECCTVTYRGAEQTTCSRQVEKTEF